MLRAQVFNASVLSTQVGQAQFRRHLADEGRLLAHGVDTRHLHIRPGDGQQHTRQAAAAAHIQQAHAIHPGAGTTRRALGQVPRQGGQHGQTVAQVVSEHLGRIAHRRQVVGGVPVGQHAHVGGAALLLCLVQRHTQRGQHRRQRSQPLGFRPGHQARLHGFGPLSGLRAGTR